MQPFVICFLLCTSSFSSASPTFMALGSRNESVGFFRVDISLTTRTDFAVQWGANPAEYIEAQNQLGSLGCIEKFQDTFYLYATDDKLVHTFGFECVDSDDCKHRLDNYVPGNTTLDAAIDFSESCDTIAYKNGTSAITFAGPTFRSDFPEMFSVTNLKSNAGAVLTDSDDSFLLWAPKDGFNLIGKKSGEAEALAGHCKGQVVEMSWPWGSLSPTNNLFVVITRMGKNTFVANRYDATAQTCKAGYTFTFEHGWAGGDDDAADGSFTISWMDSIHGLVVLTKDRLFYALPGEGPAVPTAVVDLTKKIGTPVSSIFGLKAWQY